jgi:phosphonate transport system substrate-binding protein
MRRRNFLKAAAGVAGVTVFGPAVAQTKQLRFGVGPLLPSPEDTKTGIAVG